MLAMYAVRWKPDSARRFLKLNATPAVTKGATNTREKTPSEAIPDHFQNRAVKHTSNQPPNAANKIKYEKSGGDWTCTRRILRQSKAKAITPSNGTRKLTPLAATHFIVSLVPV